MVLLRGRPKEKKAAPSNNEKPHTKCCVKGCGNNNLNYDGRISRVVLFLPRCLPQNVSTTRQRTFIKKRFIRQELEYLGYGRMAKNHKSLRVFDRHSTEMLRGMSFQSFYLMEVESRRLQSQADVSRNFHVNDFHYTRVH